jgi:hypothetical protein
MSANQHTAEEIQLSQERRDRIVNFLLEWLTGPDIDSKTLGHFRFIGEMFGINSKVKEMCRASSIQGRQELAVSIALAALNMAVSDEPVQPTERQIERRERREAAKQFEQRVAGLKSAGAGKSADTEAVRAVKKPGRTTKYYHAKRARMTEAELTADRAKRAAAMREIRARRKAARTGENAVNGLHQGIRPKYPGS